MVDCKHAAAGPDAQVEAQHDAVDDEVAEEGLAHEVEPGVVKLKSPEVMRPERQHSAAASEVVTMPLTKDEQHVDQYARRRARARARFEATGELHAAQYSAEEGGPRRALVAGAIVTTEVVRKDGRAAGRRGRGAEASREQAHALDSSRDARARGAA